MKKTEERFIVTAEADGRTYACSNSAAAIAMMRVWWTNHPELREKTLSVVDTMAHAGAVNRWELCPNGWNHVVTGRRGMRRIPCDGEAHSNPYIDNCGTCMPWGWGWIYIPEKYQTLEEYRAAKEAERGAR